MFRSLFVSIFISLLLVACGSSSSSSGFSSGGQSRDSDSDGVFDTADLCANTEPGETVNENGCAASQLNASCGSNTANITANRHYQVLLQSASGERISFEVFEPATIRCGELAQGAHPLILQGHGFGGARVSDTGSEAYRSTGLAGLGAAG